MTSKTQSDFRLGAALQSLSESEWEFSAKHKLNTAGLAISAVYAFLCPYAGIPLALGFAAYRGVRRFYPDKIDYRDHGAPVIPSVVLAVTASALFVSYGNYVKNELPHFTENQLDQVRAAARHGLNNCAAKGVCSPIVRHSLVDGSLGYSLIGRGLPPIPDNWPIEVEKNLDGANKACAVVTAIRLGQGRYFFLPGRGGVSQHKGLGYHCVIE